VAPRSVATIPGSGRDRPSGDDPRPVRRGRVVGLPTGRAGRAAAQVPTLRAGRAQAVDRPDGGAAEPPAGRAAPQAPRQHLPRDVRR